MTSVEMVTVRMSRGDVRTPWGFEIIPPCTVTKVSGSSLADRAGLHNGDHIDELQGEPGPTFERALKLLQYADHEIELVVLRDPAVASSARLWRPQVTVDTNMSSNQFEALQSHHAPPPPSSVYKTDYPSSISPYNSSPIKVSLEHKPVQEPSIPGFNRSPQPYQSAELNNNQINYAKPLDFPYTNRAEQYLLEKGGLFGTDPAVMKAREQPSYLQSETLKLIQEEEKNGRQQRSQPIKSPDAVASREVNGTQKLPHCFICGRGIIGVTCRIKDALVHPECFQCSTCGSSLRNVGHHFINEKFYCDIHGQQRQQQLGGNIKGSYSTSNTHFNPDLAAKIPPTAAQPIRVQEPPRGFYQPEILTAGPLSPAQPPIRPPLDSYSRTTVYGNQEGYGNNDDLIVIGKSNSQSTSSATLEARQMSRNFAPFIRSRSVRGIQWPPAPEKAQRTAEAIRYWKVPAEPADREKKSLQQLISEDTEIPKKSMIKSPSPERVKMHSKRVIATPHRLHQPMRNPLDAYTEKVKSQLDLSQGRSTASLLSIGQPPAVNISHADLIKAQSMMISPSQKSDVMNNEKDIEHLEVPQPSNRNEDSSPEPVSERSQLNEDWHAKSEILEEKDVLTEASSIRHSDDDDEEVDEDGFSLPRFDERTSQFLSDQRSLTYDDSVSPSMDDLDRKSIASTIKEGDDDDAISQAEKERWMREEVEQARREEAERERKKLLDTPIISESLEKLCLEQLAQTPIPLVTEGDAPNTDTGDKEIAIDIIKEHQKNLQQQQNQLSELLDNAIKYLKDTDYEKQPDYVNVQEANNNKRLSPSLQRTNYEDNTPSAKIIQSLNALEDAQRKSTTIYEQQKMPANKSYSQPPTNDVSANQAFTDGIRQHGTLVSQTSMIPFCEHCKQQIRGAYVLATGLTWCPEHFTCANPACNRRLLDTGFVEEKGKKYCEKCFETLIAPICNKCELPITADCLTALQKQWHPECFVCQHCSQPFGNAAFYLENGRPYCEQDWNTLFTTKCVACKYPIEAGDRWVEAIGSAFHSNCFSCTVCHTNLEGQSFYAKNGLPFCRIHA